MHLFNTSTTFAKQNPDIKLWHFQINSIISTTKKLKKTSQEYTRYRSSQNRSVGVIWNPYNSDILL